MRSLLSDVGSGTWRNGRQETLAALSWTSVSRLWSGFLSILVRQAGASSSSPPSWAGFALTPKASGSSPLPVVDVSCRLRPPLLQQPSLIWMKNNRSPFPTSEIKKNPKTSPYLHCAGIRNTSSFNLKWFKLKEFLISFIPVHSDSSLTGFINSTRVFSKFRAFWFAC